MFDNVIVKIENHSGTASSKQYTTLIENVKAMLTPASTEILALYPDFPVDSTYSITINADYLDAEVKPEARITIMDKMNSQYDNDEKFILRGRIQRSKVLENVLLGGVCVRIS